MEVAVEPREDVILFGIVPIHLLAPQLGDSPGCLLALHRSLAAKAVVDSDGERWLTPDSVASCLQMSPQHCQLMLHTLSAVSPSSAAAAAPSAADGPVSMHQLLLFLLAQMYGRDAHKPETQDHWPDAEARALRAVSPGSPVASTSPVTGATTRSLIKGQIQQRQRQHEAYLRGFADYLHKHQRVLLELAMDELPSQQQQAQQQRLGSAAGAAVAAAGAADSPAAQQQQPSVMAVDGPEPLAAPGPGGGDGEATASGTQDEQQQQQQPAAVAPPDQGLSRSSSAPTSLPAVLVSSQEVDRLGFLLQPASSNNRKPAGASNAATNPCGVAGPSLPGDNGPAAEGGGGGGGVSHGLSSCLPQFGSGLSTVMFEDVYNWLSACLHAAAVVAPPTPGGSSASGVGAAFGAHGGGSGGAEQQQHLLPVLALLNGGLGGLGGAGGSGQAGSAAPGGMMPASDAGAVPGLAPAAAAGDPATPMEVSSGAQPQQQQQQQHPPQAAVGPPGPPLQPIATAGGPPSPAASPQFGPNGLGPQPLLSPLSLGQTAHPMRINTHPIAAHGVVGASAGHVDERRVRGVYRGTVVRGESDVGPGGEQVVQDCVDCHIYILAPLSRVLIQGCSDCTVVVCAVGTLLRLDNCERLTLTGAAAQVIALCCHSCTLYLGTPRAPALLGDCRFITLAPFNTRYEGLSDHMRAAGLPLGGQSLWDQPLLCCGREGGPRRPCGGGGGVTPGSPLTHHHTPSAGGGGGGAGGGAAGGPRDAREGPGTIRPVLLMPPEEFLPVVVPFKGRAGPLAGGAAVPGAGGAHWAMSLFSGGGAALAAAAGDAAAAADAQQQQQQQRESAGGGVADAAAGWAFALPPPYEHAVASKLDVVSSLRGRIKGAVLDEPRRQQLQAVIQAYFREWLHSSGAIRQIFDLSKLEADECAPSGGSPPPPHLQRGGAFADLPTNSSGSGGGGGGAVPQTAAAALAVALAEEGGAGAGAAGGNAEPGVDATAASSVRQMESDDIGGTSGGGA